LGYDSKGGFLVFFKEEYTIACTLLKDSNALVVMFWKGTNKVTIQHPEREGYV
jgi:hypothetical protein